MSLIGCNLFEEILDIPEGSLKDLMDTDGRMSS